LIYLYLFIRYCCKSHFQISSIMKVQHTYILHIVNVLTILYGRFVWATSLLQLAPCMHIIVIPFSLCEDHVQDRLSLHASGCICSSQLSHRMPVGSRRHRYKELMQSMSIYGLENLNSILGYIYNGKKYKI